MKNPGVALLLIVATVMQFFSPSVLADCADDMKGARPVLIVPYRVPGPGSQGPLAPQFALAIKTALESAEEAYESGGFLLVQKNGYVGLSTGGHERPLFVIQAEKMEMSAATQTIGRIATILDAMNAAAKYMDPRTGTMTFPNTVEASQAGTNVRDAVFDLNNFRKELERDQLAASGKAIDVPGMRTAIRMLAVEIKTLYDGGKNAKEFDKSAGAELFPKSLMIVGPYIERNVPFNVELMELMTGLH